MQKLWEKTAAGEKPGSGSMRPKTESVPLLTRTSLRACSPPIQSFPEEDTFQEAGDVFVELFYHTHTQI